MIHKENVLQVFDSSQCLKAEALLVSTATREREKKFSDQFQIYREDPSSLPRSYPHVFPSKYPTSEMSAAHLYTVHILSASPRGAGWRRARTAAVPGRSRPPAPVRVWAADRCCAALLRERALRPSARRHFQSVLAARLSPPSCRFPICLIDSTPAPEVGGVASPAPARPGPAPCFPPSRASWLSFLGWPVISTFILLPFEGLALSADRAGIVF